MGFPNCGLIPAAILFDHPGISREEFVDRLNEVRVSDLFRVNEAMPLSVFGSPGFPNLENHTFHHGLHGLAKILKLSYAPQFEYLKDKILEGDKIFVRAPVLTIERGQLRDGVWHPVYFVTNRTVLEHEALQDQESFTSLVDLIERYPQFDPDFMYDFSTSHGVLQAEDLNLNANDFRWSQKSGKYFLDEETFTKIPASVYTSLVNTAESLKHKAWKVLCYDGFMFMDQFLDAFPDSKARYEQAIWDSHTSLYAKSNSMTITEFLRFRAKGE